MSTAPSLPPAGFSSAWILGARSLPGHIDPGAVALRWEDGERTYGQLRERALRLASGLQAKGLRPGDRVATHLFNRGETFELYFACAYAGLTLVPIGFRLTPREIAFILDDCTPQIIFTQDELEPVASAAVQTLDGQSPDVIVLGDHTTCDGYELLASTTESVRAASTEVQMILYTSGTTGRPKGVTMSQHSVMWFAFQQVAFYQGMDTSCTTLITGPMYNTAAINEQSIPTFLVGGTVTIMPSRGWTPRRMSDVIDRWGVTHALIYPSMMEPLLDEDSSSPVDLLSMKFVLTGGENCPPAVLARFQSRWAHVELAIGYGSTESGVVTMIRGAEIGVHPGSVGRAAGAQSFAVMDGNGSPVAPGEVGEVWTTGPAVTSGYWNAPEIDVEVISGEWLKMGDLGRVDADGYLYIVGRSKDMIISKGQNIYPAELENVLLEHPRIVDASVIAVPDVEAGEAVCACVVAAGGVPTAQELIDFVKERLASYKKPKYVIFVDSLPRNPSAKVDKKLLSDQIVPTLEGIA